jgi:hypothetical protein
VTDRYLLRMREGELKYHSPTYRALGYSFSFQCQELALVDYLGTLFEPFEMPGDPQCIYTFGTIEDSGAPNYLLFCNDRMLDNHRRAAVPFATLLWHINRSVVRNSQDWLLIHASAVAKGRKALVFPAAMESGKTTLAAGLMREGLDYITDETVAIDPETGDLEPFPRALSVDPGSWGALADMRPDVPPALANYVNKQWQVPPLSIRQNAVAGVSTPRFVVAPTYRAGSRTKLEAMSRAEAVRVLAEHSFNFVRFGGSGLTLLGSIVRRSSCYHLQVGDLAEACRLVLGLLGAGTQETAPAEHDARNGGELRVGGTPS